MRPYMLWLTRVYAGARPATAVMGIGWPNVISDWARRLQWARYQRGSYPLAAPPAWFPGSARAYRNYIESGIQYRADVLRSAPRRARAAGQGGR